MLQKKICLLGAFGVGKTSLVRRYVDTIFSDTYLTTVGVKIDKKVMTVGSEQMALILWDIAGEDAVSAVRVTYLRGAAGYLLVVDGTRPETLETAASKLVGKLILFALAQRCLKNSVLTPGGALHEEVA